ncbi:MAG: metal ABC transporter substrate-binding protein, partial [Ilumatobacteraceae bacterium]
HEDHNHEDHDDEDHDDEDHDDEDEDHDDEDHDDHDHGDLDPHVWFDPTRVAAAVPLLVDALADAGVERAALDECATAYLAELDAVDTETLALVAPLPQDRRLLVTNHDSLEYFADHYDFEVIGTVIPSSSSLAEANPADLDDLTSLIAETGTPAIFVETDHSTNDAEAVADRVGDVEVVELLTGTLGEPGSGMDTYVEWLRDTVATIVNALSGTTD